MREELPEGGGGWRWALIRVLERMAAFHDGAALVMTSLASALGLLLWTPFRPTVLAEICAGLSAVGALSIICRPVFANFIEDRGWPRLADRFFLISGALGAWGFSVLSSILSLLLLWKLQLL